jgi:hypothetical protein
VTSGSAQKFVWGSMVDFQKTTCISSSDPPIPGTVCVTQNFVQFINPNVEP